MGHSLDVYMHTDRSVDVLTEAVQSVVQDIAPEYGRLDMSLMVSNPEDIEWCRTEYRLRSAVDGYISIPRGQGGAALYRALLRVAQQADDDFIVVYEGTPMMAYRTGPVVISPAEREFFQQHVLVDSAVPVVWQEVAEPLPASPGTS